MHITPTKKNEQKKKEKSVQFTTFGRSCIITKYFEKLTRLTELINKQVKRSRNEA